jgi:hypothetical protein
MATLTIAADRRTIVTTGWTSPTNAYSTTADGVYASANPGKNLTVNDDFGFPSANLPAGAVVTAVSFTTKWKMDASVTGGLLGIFGRNNGVSDGAAETTQSVITETTVTHTFATPPSRADLNTAGRVVARVRCSKGNTASAMAGSVDYISMTITYTAQTLGTATETDTAFAITRSRRKTLETATETDSAFIITATKVTRTVNLGTATETNSSFAITRSRRATIGTATETDSSFAITRSRRVNVGLASETDSAFTFVLSRRKSLGMASETDSSFAITRSRRVTIGTANETDSAFAFVRSKRLTLGVATEVDSAFVFSVSQTSPGQTVNLGTASEVDSSFSISLSRRKALSTATETNNSIPISVSKRVTLATASETNVSFEFAISGPSPYHENESNAVFTMGVKDRIVVTLASTEELEVSLSFRDQLVITLRIESDGIN